MASIVPEELDRAGTHALVIGVSHYPFVEGDRATAVGESFGLESLSTAARSASDFAAWLLDGYHNPEAPLASLRVLLSPSLEEDINQQVAALLGGDFAATRAAVESHLAEFKVTCDGRQDNVAIVYVAGHGVQLTKHGAVVLLEDFGGPGHLNELGGAIDMAGCHAGMNHAGTAQTQFWFVDSCRQRPAVARRFESMAGALTLSEKTGHAKTSPLFLAASTREAAFAERGGTSLFNRALLWALRGGAAEGAGEACPDWHVPVSKLIAKLDGRVLELAGAHGEEQNVDPTGRVTEAVFHRFAEEPKVDLHLELIPDAAASSTRATLLWKARFPKVEDSSDWPLERPGLPAGLYLLNVDTVDPYQATSDILELKPPEHRCSVKVEP